MLAPTVVVIEKRRNLYLQVTRQAIVLQQDAVLKGLAPAFDLAPVRGCPGCPKRQPLVDRSMDLIAMDLDMDAKKISC